MGRRNHDEPLPETPIDAVKRTKKSFRRHRTNKTTLYRLRERYGFSHGQVDQLTERIDAASGDDAMAFVTAVREASEAYQAVEVANAIL